MASAKLANRTVNQSHRAIWPTKARSQPPTPAIRSRPKISVVTTLPTQTTNMTGFFASVRGSSFTKASRRARRTMGGSNSGRARLPGGGTEGVSPVAPASGAWVLLSVVAIAFFFGPGGIL